MSTGNGLVHVEDFFPDHSNEAIARLTFSTQYIAAVKESTLELADQSLKALKRTLDGDAKLVRIISSPTLSPADKSAIISAIVKPGDKTIKNLLEALAENNRLGMLGGVIDKFAVLMGAHRGEVEAVVTSAAVGLLCSFESGREIFAQLKRRGLFFEK